MTKSISPIYLDFQLIDLAADFFCSRNPDVETRFHVASWHYVDAVCKMVETWVLSENVYHPPVSPKTEATEDFLAQAQFGVSKADRFPVDDAKVNIAAASIAETVKKLASTDRGFANVLLEQCVLEYPKWKYEWQTYYGDELERATIRIVLSDQFHTSLADAVAKTWFPNDPTRLDRTEIPRFQEENHSLHYFRAAEYKVRHAYAYCPPISRGHPEFYRPEFDAVKPLSNSMIPCVVYGLLNFMMQESIWNVEHAWLKLRAQKRHNFEEAEKRIAEILHTSNPKDAQADAEAVAKLFGVPKHFLVTTRWALGIIPLPSFLGFVEVGKVWLDAERLNAKWVFGFDSQATKSDLEDLMRKCLKKRLSSK